MDINFNGVRIKKFNGQNITISGDTIVIKFSESSHLLVQVEESGRVNFSVSINGETTHDTFPDIAIANKVIDKYSMKYRRFMLDI